MKNYFILVGFIFLLALLFNNCTSSSDELNEISTNFIVVKYRTSMYIYNQKDTICYFIQYENPGQIKLITPKNIFYDKKNRTLSITNEDNTIEVFQHNNNIYGIGKINAELSSSLFKDMVFTRSNENYYDNSNYYEPDDVAAIKCGCIKETAKQKPTNCESGGEGSTQCGITDGGGVATMSWGHQCEVSCKSGYYSCCTTSNKFVY